MFKKNKKTAAIFIIFLAFAVFITGSYFYNINKTDVLGERDISEEQTKDELINESTEETSEEKEEVSSEEEIKDEPEDVSIDSEEQTEIIQKIPIMKDFSLDEDGFGIINVSWESAGCNKVRVEWATREDFSNAGSKCLKAADGSCDIEVKSRWKDYYVRLTPIDNKTEGDSVCGVVNIWDDYLPYKIEVKNNYFKYSDEKLPEVKVKNKKGEYISSDYYYIKAAPNKTGEVNAYVVFTDLYAGVSYMEVPCRVSPPEPTFKIKSINKNSIRIYIVPLNNLYDYCELEYSVNKDFSNSKKIKITKQEDGGLNTISGIKANTHYYIRVKSIKKTNDELLESSYIKTSLKTTGSAPSKSINNETPKQIVNSIKKNSSFTINLPQYISVNDAKKYVEDVTEFYPQYDKFNIDYQYVNEDISSKRVEKIKFTYSSSKASQAKKTKNKINSIVKKARKIKGTKAKVKYVNKRLCAISSYDYDAYNNYVKKGVIEDKYKYAYTAYGCLIKKKATCQGYVKAFSAIMKELNIPVEKTGTSSHVWNKIKVGKTWYHVDVTWNDCSKNKTKYLLKKTHK